MRKFLVLLLFIPFIAFADPMYSPTWGFHIDLPGGFKYVEGDGKDRFSFDGMDGMKVDIIVYNNVYNSMLELANDVNSKLNNKGEVDFFRYRDKQAALLILDFGGFSGWGLAVELNNPPGSESRPILLALSYSPAGKDGYEIFHLSVLDSICPTSADRYYPGPVMEYSHPRGEIKHTPLAINGLFSMVYENDAEAAQYFIEREFKVMEAYLMTNYIQAACTRYYRAIYRDSYDRVLSSALAVAQNLGAGAIRNDQQKREFAQKVLTFVQGFEYERDFSGASDLINPVTAITQGRGDCDARAMLFALILANADIKSGLLMSYYYSHAMALADVPGSGIRFESHGIPYLLAETTSKINIGLIDQDLADFTRWFAIVFE